MKCGCETCTHLLVYPELPALDPPQLCSSWLDPKAEWTLACHWLGPLVDGEAVLVHRGFRCDGASIPRLLWRVMGHPLQMPLLPYALAHDIAYAAELWPRNVCDNRMLRDILNDGHIPRLKAYMIYAAIRLGGGWVWRRHKPEAVTANSRLWCRRVDADTYFRLRQQGHV